MLNNPILDILEVIRNEEVFRERLEEIKKAERALAETKKLDMTMDKAERLLKEAMKDKEKYESKLKLAEGEIADLRRTKMADITAKEQELRNTRDALDKVTKEQSVRKDQLDALTTSLAKEKEELRKFKETVEEKAAQARIMKDDFHNRALRIKQIIDYGKEIQ
jgi:chromosome segregation ATPase